MAFASFCEVFGRFWMVVVMVLRDPWPKTVLQELLDIDPEDEAQTRAFLSQVIAEAVCGLFGLENDRF